MQAQVEGPDETQDTSYKHYYYVVKVEETFNGKRDAQAWLNSNELPEGSVIIKGREIGTAQKVQTVLN